MHLASVREKWKQWKWHRCQKLPCPVRLVLLVLLVRLVRHPFLHVLPSRLARRPLPLPLSQRRCAQQPRYVDCVTCVNVRVLVPFRPRLPRLLHRLLLLATHHARVAVVANTQMMLLLLLLQSNSYRVPGLSQSMVPCRPCGKISDRHQAVKKMAGWTFWRRCLNARV